MKMVNLSVFPLQFEEDSKRRAKVYQNVIQLAFDLKSEAGLNLGPLYDTDVLEEISRAKNVGLAVLENIRSVNETDWDIAEGQLVHLWLTSFSWEDISLTWPFLSFSVARKAHMVSRIMPIGDHKTRWCQLRDEIMESSQQPRLEPASADSFYSFPLSEREKSTEKEMLQLLDEIKKQNVPMIGTIHTAYRSYTSSSSSFNGPPGTNGSILSDGSLGSITGPPDSVYRAPYTQRNEPMLRTNFQANPSYLVSHGSINGPPPSYGTAKSNSSGGSVTGPPEGTWQPRN